MRSLAGLRQASQWPLPLLQMLSMLLLLPAQRATAGVTRCPGSINVAGLGEVSLVNAQKNAPGQDGQEVRIEQGALFPKLFGRTYWADSCSDSSYSYKQYKALNLLGKTFRYTVDLSATGCGCNAAVYLTSMRHNNLSSQCGDFYCDSNHVCGVSCSEIDLGEGNKYAWHSTLHTWDDGGGVSCGIGGNVNTWSKEDYGPEGRCIKTGAPFQVSVSFPLDEYNSLKGMEVFLWQAGSPCSLFGSIEAYAANGRDGLGELSAALAQGMTPVISYWSTNNLLWLDGKGPKGKGECSTDDATSCPETVRLYDFEIEDFRGSCEICPVGKCERTPEGTCMWFEGKWLKTRPAFHCKVEDCDLTPSGSAYSECWEWKGAKYYSIRDHKQPCKASVAPSIRARAREQPTSKDTVSTTLHPDKVFLPKDEQDDPHGADVAGGVPLIRPAGSAQNSNSGHIGAQVGITLVLVVLAVAAAALLGWQWFQKQQSGDMSKDDGLSYTQVAPLARSSDNMSNHGFLCCITNSTGTAVVDAVPGAAH